jgi:hypothetical protein
VLSQGGRFERLGFAAVAAARTGDPGRTTALASAGAEADPSATDSTDPDFRHGASATRERTVARVRAPRPTAVPASAAEHDEDGAADDEATKPANTDQILVDLSRQARYAPLLDQTGKLRGVALMDIRPDSTLERIGLRSGDVVVSVAGVKVDNTPSAFDALRALDPRAGGEVLVERAGVPTRIAVPPGAL